MEITAEQPTIERRSERRLMIDAKVEGYMDWLRTLEGKVDEGLIKKEEMFTIIARDSTAKDLRIDRIRDEAKTDPLTGVFNKGAFLKEFDRNIESGKQFGFLIFDIDHFKNINDTHGHFVGDKVLVQFVHTLSSNVRQTRPEEGKNDFIARYGGEEFVLITDIEDEATLRELAEKLRSNIEEKPFSIGTESKIPVTVSIGGGIYRNQGKDSFFQETDKALYEAKNNGRNQTVIAHG